MKWIALFAAAILVLVVAWLLVKPKPEAGADAEIEIPRAGASRSELVESAKQFIDFQPTPHNVAKGVQVLSSIGARLTDAEWPQAAHDLYAGWRKIHRITGSQETLQDAAADLLNRFALHLETGDLEDFIRSAGGQTTYAPRIGEALERAAGRPIRDYANSRVCLLVDTCVQLGDFHRAGRLLSLRQFVPEASDEARAPAARMARILENAHKAGEGRAEVTWVVREWKGTASTGVVRPALLAAGIAAAKSGKDKADYAALKTAMAESKAEEGAATYWQEVIHAFVDSLPKIGRYGQSDVFEALVREYAATFKDSTFESRFWEKVANDNHERHNAEVIWRIECLVRAAHAGADDARRVEMASRFVTELGNFQFSTRARQELERLTPKIESAGGKARVTALFEEIGRKEELEKVLAVKRQAERQQTAIRSEVDSLKLELGLMKQAGGAPQQIQNLEQRIKDLEKKLTE